MLCRHETDIDAKTQRGIEAKSVSGEVTKLLGHYGTKVVSEIAAISHHSEAHSQSAEWLQKTRRSAGLFCNYLACLTRMRILQAKESSLLQYKAAAKNENNSTETNLFTHSPIHLFTLERTAFTLAEGATHVAHCDKSRRVAFTLAEVLITLGIIGVVVALTLPSVIHKYKAEVLRTKFLQANTIVQDGVTQMRAADIDLNEVINNRDLPTIRKYIKGGDCRLPKNLEEANYWNYFENLPARQASATVLEQPYCMASGMTLWFVRLYEWKDSAKSDMKETKYSLLAVDINGWEQKPNVYGKDVFFWFYNGENGTLSPTGENMNVNVNSASFYIDCPSYGSAEAGAGCTSKALSEADYFKKLKL